MTTVISSARRAPCTGSRGQSSSDPKAGGDCSRRGMSFQLDPELVGSLTADVRFTPKADMCSALAHVRFVPLADILAVLFDQLVSTV